MSKIIFIGPGFIVDVLEMLSPGVADVILDLDGVKLGANIEFSIRAQSGKPETRSISASLQICSVLGPPIPIDLLNVKTSEVLQNYTQFSEVMCNIWTAGFLKFDE